MAVNPRLSWRKPIDLPSDQKDPAVKSIPAAAGIYVFYREYGESVQVFYVGKATKLQSRIKNQLNNHSLMKAISSAKNGKRKLVWAELRLKPGQSAATTLKSAEKLMIRHYVEEGQPIHNIQGKRIPVQILTNENIKAVKHFVPNSVSIDA
ncbi:GIY-YIG nuclease family protein [Pseudoduganella rhizocola]|uniref:GIY-YIG nuclease family protein n=1 Tax=Pseudoduganella rhizocola TaxID=3382643 RepID=UPI0038B4BF22